MWRVLARTRAVLIVRVGVEEDCFLEFCYLGVHLMLFDGRLEHSKVIDGALAMSGGNDMSRVLPEISCNLAPSCLNSRNGVGESAILSTHCKS